MLRPRESRDLRLIASNLTVEPDATVTWAHDIFGNTIATATFRHNADSLAIDSLADIELSSSPWPVFNIAASACSYPFRYPDSDWIDLGPLANAQYLDPQRRLHEWARTFVRSNPTDTLSLLRDLAEGVGQRIAYQSRDEEGTQGPLDTLNRGFGSCRDFAVLFIEAVRSLGFGARIVSGYFYNHAVGSRDMGSTHAWAEVYVPGAGWIPFDPTNHIMGSFNLIPVAVARDIKQAMPISGSFVGTTGSFAGMTVEVSVTAI